MLFLACAVPPDLPDASPKATVDADGDGYSAGTDCNDRSARVNPGATEQCNRVDDDCDGAVDEAGAAGSRVYYRDADGDTYGRDDRTRSACSRPTGYAQRSGDCNDTNAAVSPGATETWYDGVDGDCNGLSDDDQDLDGLDAASRGGEDCDDTDPTVGGPFTGASCDDPDGSCVGLDTIYVPADHPTVQEAIDAAVDGQEVCVAPGTYAETLHFHGKEIEVRAGLGPSVTVLDGEGSGPVVTFRTQETLAVLEGFTITGGSASDGGAILVDGADDLSPTLRNLHLTGNTATDDGGALYVSAAIVTMEDVTCTANVAGDSGGCARVSSSAVTLSDVEVSDNAAGGAGGGLALRESAATVSDLVLQRNVAALTGGGLDLLGTGGTWTDVTLTENVAAGGGGGLYNDGTRDMTWTRALFVGNRAADGGGVYLAQPVAMRMSNALFVDNVVPGDGSAAAFAEACAMSWSNVTAVRNEADCGTFTVLASCTTGTAGPTVLHSSIVASNTGTTAGGICAYGGGRIRVSYTDLYDNGTNYSGMSDESTRRGNITDDPSFVTWSASEPWELLDLHLGTGSPAIDAGDPSTVDADGTIADMGGYGGPGGSW